MKLVLFATIAVSSSNAAAQQLVRPHPSYWRNVPCDTVRKEFREDCVVEHAKIGIPENASGKVDPAPDDSLPEPRAATEQEIEYVRAGLDDQFKDADSARFKNVLIVRWNNEDVVCGYVNAKNSFGGYTGYSKFIGAIDQEREKATIAEVSEYDTIARSRCAKYGM